MLDLEIPRRPADPRLAAIATRLRRAGVKQPLDVLSVVTCLRCAVDTMRCLPVTETRDLVNDAVALLLAPQADVGSPTHERHA